ncbi:DET1- and DDB1-associated protein 1 [Euwallacea fornicatus]|uniref:DET1- and DDB1-associated protein 1 n=1 Tax=Euwallacea fornicatus TaxID=995702 RepID=UPI00339001E4
MSVAQFLAGLPSYNETNFSKFHMEGNHRTASKRPSVYITTRDFPSEQVIVTEKNSILLKYMQQHWDKKNSSVTKKREVTPTEEPSRKRPRLDPRNPGGSSMLD